MGFEGVWLFVSIGGNRDELWLSLTFDTVPGGHDAGRRSLIRRDGLSRWKIRNTREIRVYSQVNLTFQVTETSSQQRVTASSLQDNRYRFGTKLSADTLLVEGYRRDAAGPPIGVAA